MKIHKLKTLLGYFEAIGSGEKLFESRRDDRGFQVGDYLELQEFDGKKTTGRLLVRRITYKLEGGQFGIRSGYCVLGLELDREFGRQQDVIFIS